MSAPRRVTADAVLWALTTLALLAALGGCAASAATPGGAVTTLVEVPTQWSGRPTSTAAPAVADAATDKLDAPPWWLRYGDLVLNQLMTDALAHNPGIASSRAVVRQAWALQQVAAAALLPSAGVGLSAGRSAVGNQGALNSLQADLSAQWVPDVFGGNRLGADAARFAAQASQAALADAQLSLTATVGLAYTSLRSAQARTGIAAENLASQQETLQIVRWRQQAGLVTELEVEQARAQTEQTAALLPALQTNTGQNRHALALLTGRAPAALDSLLLSDGRLPESAQDLALAIPAEALRQRADVRAAERQVRAATARVGQAEAARYPSFALGGSLGVMGSSVAALRASTALLASLVASAALPVLDGGARRATVRAQQAAYDQAHLAYQTTVLGALRDVEDALLALGSDLDRLTRLRAASSAAANAATLARQRFASGLVDFQTVLETQRTQLSTQDAVASARADVTADQVRLFKALGGGWRNDDEAPAAQQTWNP